MFTRISAIAAGAIAAAAVFYFLLVRGAASRIWVQATGGGDFDWPARLAWSASMALSIFAVVALAAALIAGLVETLTTRSRLNRLRSDPDLAGHWGGADWRAAFARTAIQAQAEATIAGFLPAGVGVERRVIIDPAMLIGIEPAWVERLSLTRTIAPLPLLALAAGAGPALFEAYRQLAWEVPLMAGIAGWFAISAAHYLVRGVLGWVAALCVDCARAAIHPITTAPALAFAWAANPAPAAQADRDDDSDLDVDPALSEIRAGIERLLSGTPGAGRD
jgi:hypothetical protein